MLNCRQCIGELGECLDGPPDPAVADHLQRCRKCRVVWDTTRQTVTLYRRTWSFCPVPPDVEARLLTALETRLRR